MKYKNIVKGRFISRPNRFTAIVETDGEAVECHVKNTGRCRELLIENAEVFLATADNPKRKTKYDLVTVNKNGILINIDSYAPNIAFGEFLRKGGLFCDAEIIKSECKYGNSRFDFYIREKDGKESYAEVKGVTLEDNGVCMFPDAPTERGVKHIRELTEALKNGFGAYIVFVIQLNAVKYFIPNEKTHPEFAAALKEAQNRGVKIFAYNCNVTENSMEIGEPVKIKI